MFAKIENGMLFLKPENEQQRIEANKWYEETSKNYDEMSDFMIWVEQVPENFQTQSKKIKLDKTNIISNIRSNSKTIEITETELRGLIFWASNGIMKSRGGSYYSTIEFIKNNYNLMVDKNRFKNLVFGSRLENKF
jgi:hypothetical protein